MVIFRELFLTGSLLFWTRLIFLQGIAAASFFWFAKPKKDIAESPTRCVFY
jgi:hypothetical protein